MRKRAKIENSCLNAHQHININSHIEFQENHSNGIGGVAITIFFLMRTAKGCKSRKENPQKLTQLSSRSHPRHLVEKRTAQKDITIDTTSRIV